MTNAKVDSFLSKDAKSYAGGLSSVAGKAFEKVGEAASEVKKFAKKNPALYVAAAVVLVAATAPASASSSAPVSGALKDMTTLVFGTAACLSLAGAAYTAAVVMEEKILKNLRR